MIVQFGSACFSLLTCSALTFVWIRSNSTTVSVRFANGVRSWTAVWLSSSGKQLRKIRQRRQVIDRSLVEFKPD